MDGKQWIHGCVLVLTLAMAAHATTFFVNASTGNDSNPGTSPAKPFLTIQKAINQAALRPGSEMIHIAAGQYGENLSICDTDQLTLSGSSGAELVASSASDAIKITSGDISISDLVIADGNKGISADSSAGPVSLSLRDSVVRDNAGDGLNAANVASVSVSQCEFRANGGAAIKVQSAEDLSISHSVLELNTGRGIRADDVEDVSVSNCQILNNNDDGMKVVTKKMNPADASLSVLNTIVSGNYDDGIDLEALGDIRLVNVEIEGTVSDDGLSVDDSASVSVTNCTLSNNAADGLDMDDTPSISVVNVESTGNGDSGFDVTAEDVNIESVSIVNSEFLGNGLDGVWIGEENAVVEQAGLTHVTASNNGESGLDITITGTLRLTAITSEGNGAPDIL